MNRRDLFSFRCPVCEKQYNCRIPKTRYEDKGYPKERMDLHLKGPECLVFQTRAKFQARGWTDNDKGYPERWFKKAGVPHEIAPRTVYPGVSSPFAEAIRDSEPEAKIRGATIADGVWAPAWAGKILALNKAVGRTTRVASNKFFTPEVRVHLLFFAARATPQQIEDLFADIRKATDAAHAVQMLSTNVGHVHCSEVLRAFKACLSEYGIWPMRLPMRVS